MAIELDHLVVGAATLTQGGDWVRSRLGAEPIVGGRHTLMGTHNLLLRLDAPVGQERYLEILAVDPDAPDPGRPRWFDLDAPAVRVALTGEPRLLAWVARSDAIEADRERLVAAGVDPGPLLEASRATADGMLRWRLTVPLDGRRVARGAVPMLIAWDGRRPATSLTGSRVSLERLVVHGVTEDVARMLRPAGSEVVDETGPALRAVLRTPVGRVELEGL